MFRNGCSDCVVAAVTKLSSSSSESVDRRCHRQPYGHFIFSTADGRMERQTPATDGGVSVDRCLSRDQPEDAQGAVAEFGTELL